MPTISALIPGLNPDILVWARQKALPLSIHTIDIWMLLRRGSAFDADSHPFLPFRKKRIIREQVTISRIFLGGRRFS